MLRQVRSLIKLSRSFHSRVEKPIQLINVPFCGGQPKKGVELAPNYLRDSGLLSRITKLGRRVHDAGDLDVTEPEREGIYGANVVVKNPLFCGNVAGKAAQAVISALNRNRIPVTVGGDHSISTGTVFGSWSYNNSVCVIWVDAHADINSPIITKSGNIHGMATSWIIKGIPEFPVVPGYEWVQPCISPNKLAYIGLRDVEPQEVEILNDLGIAAYFMDDIDELGIELTMEKVLDDINPNKNCPIHVSFDIDVMDPKEAPSTGTTVRGGLTLSEAIYICQTAAQTGLLQAVDLVEVNPKLGSDEDAKRTAETAMILIETLLGKQQEIPKEDLIPYNQMKKNDQN